MSTLVFLPGIMGSELVDSQNDKVWPPRVTETIFGYNRVDELLDPTLTATRPIRSIAFFYGIYDCILDDIENCGYHEDGATRNFIPFAYDWRKSNTISAQALADRLDSVSIDGDIILLAHSMGGLICRHLLESGLYENRSWFSSIKMLITMGTPFGGAPASLSQITGSQSNLGIDGEDLHRLTADERYGSAYELAPMDDLAMVVRSATSGEVPATVSAFDDQIKQAFKLSQTNIDAARQFWSTLDLARRPAHVDYFAFFGSAHKTKCTNVWNGVELLTETVLASGDGTVPIASSMLAGIPHAYSRKKHTHIFEDRDLRVKLYRLLDAPADLEPFSADDGAEASDVNSVGLSVDRETYQEGEEIEVLVSFSMAQDNPRISLKLERFDLDSEDDLLEPALDAPIITRISGAEISHFSLTLLAELEPGKYALSAIGIPSHDPAPTTFYVTAG